MSASLRTSRRNISNMLCKRNGVSVESFSFKHMPEEYSLTYTKAIRAEVSVIRNVVGTITADMNQLFSAQEKSAGKSRVARGRQYLNENVSFCDRTLDILAEQAGSYFSASSEAELVYVDLPFSVCEEFGICYYSATPPRTLLCGRSDSCNIGASA